ncbi:hypothetical protein Goshw_014766 [Gossypium schwendimanii]|uniref:CCHC-type domain-containing protein n=1 Tax=Gossypium schwendimanii TaxID=34291 RepID=A0A7J9MBN6_GOSSC|nr:hypothetical protein [Gossypium schwendimanii]
MVGNVIKIYLLTNKGARGQFARFEISIDLSKLFVSRIRIVSRIHRVEYESFPTVCFGCGTFEHLKGDCPQLKIMENKEKGSGEVEDPVRLEQYENTGSIQEPNENERFGEWKILDHRNRRPNQRTDNGQESGNRNNLFGSQFNIFPKQVSHKMTTMRMVQVNKQAVSGPRIENQDGGIKENGMSFGTLKIRMKWGLGYLNLVPMVIQGMVDCLEVEGRAVDIREENVELVVLDQAVSGKILGQPSGVVHGVKNDATLRDDSFDV